MTTTAIPTDAEFIDARSSFLLNAGNERVSLDTLFAGWCRLRRASARQTVDPLSGISFGEAREAAITSRISGTAAVLPTAVVSTRGKGK
jgi:hypothetical protein